MLAKRNHTIISSMPIFIKLVTSLTLLFLFHLYPARVCADWESVTSGSIEILKDVHFLNASLGIAVGENSTVLVTNDGGSIWSPVLSAQLPSTGSVLNAVQIVDINNAWIAGDSGLIWHSSNPGNTSVAWTSQTAPSTNNLNALDFYDNQNGYVAGSTGTVHRTTNGTSWTSVGSGDLQTYFDIAIPPGSPYGADEAQIALTNRTVTRTINNGTSWQSVQVTLDPVGTGYHFYGIDFPVDNLTGYISARFGRILKTTDGVNWIELNSTVQSWNTALEQWLLDVHFPVDANTGYVVGFNGIVLKTIDGTLWESQVSGTNEQLHGVYFVSNDVGFAVGENGTIIRTSDGGGNAQDALHPSSDGSVSFSTLNCNGEASWQCVNDQPSDATTGVPSTNLVTNSYIESTGANIELYKLDFNSIPAGSFINSIQLYAKVGRTNGPAPSANLVYKLGGDPIVSSPGFTGFEAVCCENVISYNWTGLNISRYDLNNLQTGVQHDGTGTLQVSQFYTYFTYVQGSGVSRSISGKVFNDANFNGSGANFEVSDVGIDAVTLELYTPFGTQVQSISTSNGDYTFSNIDDGTYQLRVVSSTITGVPEMTGYNNESNIWTDRYGGQDASISDTLTGVDAGPGDTYITIDVNGGNLTNINIGFAYNLIVRKANSNDQGTLGRFLANATAGLLGTENRTSQFRMLEPTNRTDGAGNNWWAIQLTTLNSAYAAIASGTVLDGSTQRTNMADSNTLGPEIELYCSDCSSLSTPATGFIINGGSNITINEFILSGFGSAGIALNNASDIIITGNYIGTDGVAASAAAISNWQYGISIGNSSNVTVGGTTAAARNIISGNGNIQTDDGGVLVSGTSSGNTIIGNYIGVDRTGNTAIANNGQGITLKASAAVGSTTGRNIISGNISDGIKAQNTSGTVDIKNNYIGTGANGTATLANGGFGINITGAATSNTIGGVATNEGNLIANSVDSGINLITSGTNTFAGNTVRNNTVHGLLSATANLVIQKNIFDANGGDGINVGASSNIIYHNTIYNSSNDSIEITAAGSGTLIKNNILHTSGAWGINDAAGLATTDVTYNDFNTYISGACSTGCETNTGNTGDDPLLADPAYDNFNLSCSSPTTVLDGATNTGQTWSMVGTGYDLGAIEGCVNVYSVSGTVFVDEDYTTATGYNATNDTELSGVTVELYDSGGIYIKSTTTSTGIYTFTGINDTETYTVRVLSATVSSAAETTYGTAVPDTTWINGVTQYGGQNAAVADPDTNATAGIGDTYTTVTISGSAVSNVDFGFAYNLIVNTNDSGQGSLRQFMLNVNTGNLSGVELTSQFLIPSSDANRQVSGVDSWYRITPLSALPVITSSGVTLNAATQVGSNNQGPEIEIRGDGAIGSILTGLAASNTTGVTLQGFIVNNFDAAGASGILISGASASANNIYGNYVGMDALGETKTPNRIGVSITAGALNTSIGGISAGQGNLISGNTTDGISIVDSSGTTIKANYIGPNISLINRRANSGNGITISGSTATVSNTVIGGATTAERNIISGNDTYGIDIVNDVADITIQGNIIGTGLTGNEVSLANIQGIIARTTNASPTVQIGGLNSGEGNIVGHNTGLGIEFQNTVASGANKIEGNTIYDNSQHGISVQAPDVLIQKNLIYAQGPAAGKNGILVTGASSSNTLIYYNTIYNNTGDGIQMAATAGTGTTIRNNIISNNDVNGIGNSATLGTQSNNIFFGNTSGDCNGCSINATSTAGYDPLFTDPNNADFTLTCSSPAVDVAQDLAAAQPGGTGNYSGSAWDAGYIESACNAPKCRVTNTSVNGAGSLDNCLTFAQSNVGTNITFNIPTSDGNFNVGSGEWTISPTTTLPTINANNTILDGSSQTTHQGDLNASGPEIIIDGVNHIDSGFTITSADNIVSGLNIKNHDAIGKAGILVSGASASGNNIRGNHLLGNYYGAHVEAGATGNTIGGSNTTYRNVISANIWDGIRISGATTTGNTISGNYIGTDETGLIANGNYSSGILVFSNSNTIGGTLTEERNTISGNGFISGFDVGIQILSDSNTIYGNYIGVGSDGITSIGNSSGGIVILGNNNTVGGIGNNEANIVANDAFGDGILVKNGSVNTQIAGNQIYSNASLGINLEAGANNDKTAPTISSITTNVSDFDVIVTSTSGDTIEFYRANNSASPAVTPDAAGEGFLYLGTCVDNGACSGPHINTIADADATAGVVQATLLSSGVTGGDEISSIASDATNGTSEFSSNYTAPMSLYCTVINTNNSGAGSLYDCISYAIANTGTTIQFNIPDSDGNYNAGNGVWVITPPDASQFPAIGVGGNGTVIDATTQTANQGDRNPNGPEIEIDGSLQTLTTDDGFELSGDNITIKGFVIHSFLGAGIRLVSAENAIIQGNYIGTDSSGTLNQGNGDYGIRLESFSHTAQIGGTGLNDGNLISGNGLAGTLDAGISIDKSNNVIVQGNLIGTNRNQSAAIANIRGINITSSDALNPVSGLVIGGNAVGAENVISGNTNAGISGSSKIHSVTIQGNYIGTDDTGTVSLGNNLGMQIATTYATPDKILVGGTGTDEGNLIAQNTNTGVWIESAIAASTGYEISGNRIRNNDSGIVGAALGLLIRKNYVHDNTNQGVNIFHYDNQKVYNNTIHKNDIGISSDNFYDPAGYNIQNNIITNNTTYGVYHHTDAIPATTDYNLYNANGTQCLDDSGADSCASSGANSPTPADPQYNGEATTPDRDFTLTCASPAVEVGTDLGSPDQASFGGNNPDLGAYETSCIGGVTISLHPQSIAASGFTTASCTAGAPANWWQCVNDQAGEVGTGVPEAQDGEYIQGNSGASATFELINSAIPGGSTITAIEIFAKVGATGADTGAYLSYQRIGTDGAAVESPLFNSITVGCCTTTINYAWTGLTWSTTDIDNLRIGLRHNGGLDETQVDQLYVTVTYIAGTTTYTISGTAYEDANYSGSPANWDTGINDKALANVTVELYDSGNSPAGSTTTNASGYYEFTGLSNDTYSVRAVTSTIGDVDTIPHGGYNTCVPATCSYPVPEMSWAYNAAKLGGAAKNTSDIGAAAPGDSYASITVNNADVANVNLGFAYNAIVNTNDTGQGSLRQFILNSNAIDAANSTTANTSAFDSVTFPAATPATITLLSDLPQLSSASMILNAANEGVVIDGNTNTYHCIWITSNNNSIKGLTIQNCIQWGVQIQSGTGNSIGGDNTVGSVIAGVTHGEGNIIINNGSTISFGGIKITSNDNFVYGNLVGTDGSTNQGNAGYGIYVLGDGNTIGSTDATLSNVVSGNNFGVYLTSANNNTVQGNYIGTNIDATGSIANSRDGVRIAATSTGNTIGGLAAGSANVIAGNGESGYYQTTTNITDANNVYGNFIGQNAAATPIANTQYGIYMLKGTLNLGNTGELQSNVIAPNTLGAVNLTIDAIINTAGTIDIDGNVVASAGNLNLGSAGLNLAGNWSNSGATVNVGTSVLVLDGTAAQTITTGTDNFNNVTVTNASIAGVTFADGFSVNNFTAETPSSMLTFTSGQTYTFTGTLTLNGQKNTTRIQLNASAASPYTFDVQSETQFAYFVDVDYAVTESNNIIAYESIDPSSTTDAIPTGSPPQWIFESAIVVNGTNDCGDPDCIRQAIILATSGQNIVFNPKQFPTDGPVTITITESLLANTDNLIITGENAGVIIDGGGAVATCLTIDASNITVRGLRIQNCTENGILIQSGTGNVIGGNNTSGRGPSGEGNTLVSNGTGTLGNGLRINSNNNFAYGNYIGIAPSTYKNYSPAEDLGNHINGIYIASTASGNIIGATATGRLNILSANDANGILIEGNSNILAANYLGMNEDLSAAFGNTTSAVLLSGSATGNNIGGTGNNEGNLISGNLADGIVQNSSGSNNAYGNTISDDTFPNGDDGVESRSGTLLLGVNGNQSNVITANTGYGVHVNGGAINFDSSIDINDDVRLTSGSMDMGNTTINLSGNWIQVAGSVIAGSSTLILDSTTIPQDVNTGSGNNFYNIEVNNSPFLVRFLDGFSVNNFSATTASTNLQFQALQTYTINGLLNINGQAPGTEISLASSNTTDQFTFNVPNGNQSVSYVNVSYSNADGKDINAYFPNTVVGNDDGDPTPHWVFNNSVALTKRAFLADGTPLSSGEIIPKGQTVKFIIYINNIQNTGITDVSVVDVLDPTFSYQLGTLKINNAIDNCALPICTVAEEAAIFTALDGAALLTDGIDTDEVSYTLASKTVEAGDAINTGNKQLDILANKVWAILITVTMQ